MNTLYSAMIILGRGVIELRQGPRSVKYFGNIDVAIADVGLSKSSLAIRKLFANERADCMTGVRQPNPLVIAIAQSIVDAAVELNGLAGGNGG